MRPQSFHPNLLILGVLVPCFLVALLAVLVYRSHREVIMSTHWVTHTVEVQHHIQSLGRELAHAEAGQRGFLLTSNESYLKPYQTALTNIPVELGTLHEMTADNPLQQSSLEQVTTVIHDRLSELAQTISLEQQGQRTAALNLVSTDSGQNNANGIRRILANMDSEEQSLLAQRQAQLADQSRLDFTLAMSLVLSAAIFCAWILTLIYRLARSQAWVTVCAWTKTIEVDGEWLTFEEYLQRRFGFKVSHGMSPEGTREFFSKVQAKGQDADKKSP